MVDELRPNPPPALSVGDDNQTGSTSVNPTFAIVKSRLASCTSQKVSFSCVLLVATGCYWLLLVATGCYWLLLVAAGCYWLLLVATGCYWLLLVATDSY
jgi:hypothetical protein